MFATCQAGRGRALGLAVLLLAALCTVASDAGAAEESPFEVNDVRVDETASSALLAKQTALQRGQREALARVLRRLTLKQDHARLPAPDGLQIAELVESLEISGEKTSPVRYLATLKIRFRRESVRELFNAAGIPYTETRARPVLILPVLESAGVLTLFEDGNDWRRAWGNVEFEADGMLPLRLPLGDLQDITSIAPEAAVAGQQDLLLALADRYGAESVIVAQAIISVDISSSRRQQFSVAMHRYGEIGQSTTVRAFSPREGEDTEAFYTRVAATLSAQLYESWKRQTLLGEGEGASVSVHVPIDSLQDWLEIRQRLAAVGMLRTVELRSISRRAAQVVLHASGSMDGLAVSLAARDLELRQDQGLWVLALRDSRSTERRHGGSGEQ